MSTYREIHGKAVKSLSTDPSGETDAGQIWYNTSSNTFKSILTTTAWSSAGAMSTARSGLAGGGIQTAAWGVGGVTAFPATTSTLTEEYNGSGWSAGGAIPTGKVYAAGAGPQTAGLVAAGGPPFSPSPGGAQTTSFSYNGTSWSAETATPVGLWTNAGFGSEPSFVSVGSEPSTTNYVFNYDGSSWTTGGTMNSIRSYVGACGTQTAGGAIAGFTPSATSGEDKFETYDGSSWTAAPTLNSARYTLAGAGSLTAALAAGGRTAPGPSNATELYDGSSWTNSSNMGTGKAYAAESNNAPDNTAAVVFAGSPIGDPSTILATSEEFNNSINVITGAAWASAPTFPDSRRGGYTAGTQGGTIYAGGYLPGGLTDTSKSYDGSSWTAAPTFYESKFLGGACGTFTAALTFGGNGPAGANRNTTGTWNGSSWTSGPTLPTGNQGNSGFGTQTAGVSYGGSGDYDYTAEFNGSSWTAVENMNVGRYGAMSSGTLTAGFAMGGENPAGGAANTSASYDGTDWTAGATLPTNQDSFYGCSAIASSGTAGSMLAGGYTPSTSSVTANSVIYNGSSFETTAAMGTARYNNMTGDNTSALASAGYVGPSNSNLCEEYTGATSSINTKTLTQS